MEIPNIICPYRIKSYPCSEEYKEEGGYKEYEPEYDARQAEGLALVLLGRGEEHHQKPAYEEKQDANYYAYPTEHCLPLISIGAPSAEAVAGHIKPNTRVTMCFNICSNHN
jgi:hypothetical protein